MTWIKFRSNLKLKCFLPLRIVSGQLCSLSTYISLKKEVLSNALKYKRTLCFSSKTEGGMLICQQAQTEYAQSAVCNLMLAVETAGLVFQLET